MVALGALLVHISAVAVEYNPSEYVRQNTASAFHRPRATYASDNRNVKSKFDPAFKSTLGFFSRGNQSQPIDDSDSSIDCSATHVTMLEASA